MKNKLNKSLLFASTVLVLQMISASAFGQTAPTFTVASPTLTLCQNVAATDITSLLKISDIDAGQTETWSILSAPAHGSLGGFNAIHASGSTSITPTGLTYQPVNGYSGTDAFTIKVSDGSNIITTTVNVTVNPLANPGTISGNAYVCTSSTTTLSDGVSGGVWSSSSAHATIGASSGIVTGVSAGTTTISYAVTNGCGTQYATSIMTVNSSLPTVSSITGTTTVCPAATTTLSDVTSGGTWSSSSANATVGSSTGVVTGVTAGTSLISYGVTNGCGTTYTTSSVTISALANPGTITGTATVCPSGTTDLNNTTGGGVWSSSNANATVNSSDGVVTGVTAGTSTISYGVTNTCGTQYATKIVTINPAPSAGSISGTAVVCVGATTSLTESVSGGTWSSSSTRTATIGTSGIVTGARSGNTTISYTFTNSCGTSYATKVVTVTPLATASYISGSSSVCTGATITLTDGTVGGVWSSSNANATIGTSGIVTGVTAGTVTISYGVTNSCSTVYSTKTITVNQTYAASTLTGTASVCVGATTTLSDATSGGTWSSSSTSKATVSTSGVVTGVAAGTVTISYKLSNTCGTVYATKIVTVNVSANAGTITGTATVCQSATTALTDAISGGTWSSSNASATVGTTGVVTGVTAGTATISYGVTNTCGTVYTTKVVTINALASAGTITGSETPCVGATTTYSDATGGGTWSSSNANATVGTTGIVNGVAAGTATISYGVTNTCGTQYATKNVSVNALANPGTITGITAVCVNATTSLSNSVSGGTWTSSSANATIGSTGIVTGVTAGTTIISYAATNVCGTRYATSIITVNALAVPGTISGTYTVCAGSTTTLTDAAGGGIWSSGAANATVGTSGIVTGATAGTATISYGVTNGCGTLYATKIVTVNPLAAAGTITGASAVCTSSSITLTDAAGGGTWSSSSTSIATVASTGNVTGVAAGTVTISYTVTNSCNTAYATKVVTVNNTLPSAGTISGALTICAGSNTTFTDAVAGGVWSSSNTSYATVGTNGVVTGVALGTPNISYGVTNGCGTSYVTKSIIVSVVTSLPNAGTITGTTNVCVAATTTLSNTAGGGVWSSSNTSYATIGSTGIVTGVASGTSTISYGVSNACGTNYAVQNVTVNPLAIGGTINGTPAVCAGATTSLTDTVSGGTWSSSNANATVGSTGVVTGVTAGTATISYTVTNSCNTAYATRVVTINALANAGTITGTATVCVLATTSLTDGTSGGFWVSSAATATVGSTGVVTGVSGGTTTISYGVTNGCGTQYTTKTVTINPLANSGTITGNATVCSGTTTSFTESVSGGTWSSSNTAKATIGTSGLVTGVAVGTATISYAVANTCGTQYATQIITVNTTIAAGTVTGTANACVGATTALTSSVLGGIWTSSSANATVGYTGIVTGITAGTATISYAVTNTCGTQYATDVVTINPLANPGTVSGSASVCTGTATSFSHSVSGGTWSSSNANATITTGGSVTGVTEGVATISYGVTNGCGTQYATQDINVITIPDAGSIYGTATVCVGATTDLNDDATGSWSSSSAIATIDTTGTVTGITAGTVNISYSATNGCGTVYTTQVVTVNPLANPGTITGVTSVCTSGDTTLLSDAVAGGIWSTLSDNADVDTNGVVSGVIPGTATIYYGVTNGCGTQYATTIVTINGLPNVGTITGASVVCVAATTSLSENVSGGTWTSSSASATVNASGVVTGVTAGMTTISYALTNGCGTNYQTQDITINPLADPGTITGTSVICIGGTTSLTDASAGGVWSSSAANATVDASGNVTGVSAGTVVISYGVTNSCGTRYATQTITVNSLAVSVTNSGVACVNGSVTLSSGETGSAPSVNYSWSGPLGYTAASASPVLGNITANMAGIYTVVATASASGCSATGTTVVSVNPVPVSTGVVNSGQVCAGAPSYLTSNSINATSWSWTGSDGFTSSVANPTVTPTATTTYTLMVSSTGNGCSPSTIYTSTVYVTPIPSTTGVTNSGAMCSGASATLYSNSSNTVFWTWMGSDGSMLFNPNPIVTPAATTTYSLTLTSIGYGCNPTTVYTTTVTVNPLPSSTGATNSGLVCAGTSATLHSNSTAATSWVWTGSDGFTSTSANPGVTPSTTTSYSLAISSTGAGCAPSTVYTTIVSVNPVPSSTGATNSGTICVGSSATLNANASNATSYSWTAPGFSSSSANPTVTPSVTTTYSLTLASTGSGCNPATVYTTTVVVNSVPSSTGATNGGAICGGGSTMLHANSSNTTSWSWIGSDGFSSSLQNVSVSPVATTTYSLTLGSTGTGCAPSTVYTTMVTVNSLAVAASNSGAACQGGSVTLSSGEVGSAPSVSYAWSGPSGYTSASANPVLSNVTTANAGVYTVTATSTGSGCTSAGTTLVTVNTMSVAASGNNPHCSGGTVVLSSGFTGNAPSVTYSWNGPLGFSSSLASPVITASTTDMSGTYTVTASSAGSGCTASSQANVVINQAPSASASNDGAACAGGTVHLNANGVATGTASYAWSGPSGFTSTSAAPVLNNVTTAMAGVYSVTISTNASACTAGSATTVVVAPAPSLSGATNGGVICAGATLTLSAGTAANVTGYSWSGPAAFSSSAANPSISPVLTNGAGTYTVTVVNGTGSGCSASYTTVASVNPVPSPIGGTATVCAGAVTTLTEADAAGTWSSSMAHATVDASGNVTGVTAGNSTISYTFATGCTAKKVITVNTMPVAITGTSNICLGATAGLTDLTPGGVWTSSVPAVASVGSVSGSVTALSSGVTSISYVVGNCMVTVPVTVNALPATVTTSGAGTFCGAAAISAANGTDGTIYFEGTTSGGTSTAIPSAAQTVTASGTYYFRALSASGCWGAEGSVTVSVNPLPATISGVTAICLGSSATLTNDGSGTWTSSDATIASVNSVSGVVSATGAGTAVISYTNNNGCVRTSVVTVNPVAPISGNVPLCAGSTVTLTDAVTGGGWSSNNGGVATFSGIGLLTAAAQGTANITYTTAAGCTATAIVTVNSPIASIAGISVMCQGSAYTFTNASAGGNWNIADATVATADAGGLVTAVNSGSTSISYTIPGNGCIAVKAITVNPGAAIANNTAICAGSSVTLTNSVSGGTWSTGSAAIATISSTGVMTAVNSGTTVITYSTPSGCQATATATVNTTPAPISGSASLCNGMTTALSADISGGTWSSIGNATVDASGVVTGAAQGVATIVYTLANGCSRSVIVTVNAAPTAISGRLSLCAGSSVSLTADVTGGSWASSNTAVAGVDAASGVASALAGGTTTITYSAGMGCYTTATLTVNPILPVTGNVTACVGSTIALSDASAGGTWSAANALVASVDASGVVTGNSVGTTLITYTISSGCARTAVVTVNASATVISGNTPTCPGSTIALNGGVGGSWSSSAPSVASVDAVSGLVSAINTGNATITYTAGAGCYSTVIVTVNTALQIITGSSAICINSATTLHNTTTGGAWSSANTTVGTIDGVSGTFAGIAAGSSVVSYNLGNGCYKTFTITVNPLPAAISGNNTVCVGSSTMLSDATTPALSWTTSDTTVATILANGIVTPRAAGSVMVTYTAMGTNCSISAPLYVTALPGAISGNTSICLGSSAVSLSDTGSGTWSSSNTAVASVGAATGTVTGIATGNATITYRLAGAGCYTTTTISVNPVPTVTSCRVLCVGASATLGATLTGGTWSCTGGSACIGSASGAVTGLAQGTATVSYTTATGCNSSTVVTVNAIPTAITGNAPVCIGSVIALRNTISGTWSSSNGNVSVDGSGNATGVSTGNAAITFTSATGCTATTTVTVNALPIITGTTAVCAGAATTLNSNISGGTWSSANAAAGTVASGVFTALSAGTSAVSYTTPAGCVSTAVVTVNPLPAAISGQLGLCVGTETTLANSTPGGTWSVYSFISGAVTVDAAGIVSGLSASNAFIYYTLPTGCLTRSTVTVTAMPAAITGAQVFCQGSGATMSNTTTGGVWTTANSGIASVSATGVVSGAGAGTTTITYTTGSSCIATTSVTVNAQPAAISGPASVCNGSTTLFTGDGTGTWLSTVTSVANIGSSSGILSALNSGATTVSYTNANGCFQLVQVTVNATVGAITGSTVVCIGTSSTLNNSTTGTWSSSNTAIGTIDMNSGTFTGITPGTATVVYTSPAGCTRSIIMTVNPSPAAITGNTTVCLSGTTTLYDASTPANNWITGNTSVATILANGVVTPVSVGTTTVTYVAYSGCTATTTLNVISQPAAITGNVPMCTGASTVTLSDVGGGTWTCSNTSIATVGAATGIVTPLTTGNATITYNLSGGGCRAIATITVNPSSAVTGNAPVCSGFGFGISNTIAGGTWSSVGGAIVVGSTNGLVVAMSPGTATVLYTLPTGCNSSAVVTVNARPAAITNNTPVCVGSVITLANASTGTWRCGAYASIDSVGNVTGLSAGTSTITFTASATGCYANAVVTINPIPAIVGAGMVCAGSSISLLTTSSGGTWSSANTSVGTVGTAAGMVTTLSAGTATISYTLATGCAGKAVVTVNPNPSPITGAGIVCAGSSISLSETNPGGTWSSGNLAIGTVNTSGSVMGLATGSVNITYTFGTGCYAKATVTVATAPGTISGSATVCTGATGTLTNSVTTGAWGSTNTAIATVGALNGIVSGISAGTVIITYNTVSACNAVYKVVTINASPTAITPSTICQGVNTTMASNSTGGTWVSLYTSVATIGSATGIMNGVNTGSTPVTYNATNGCKVITTISVNPAPGAITGGTSLCAGGLTSTLACAGGGTWSSADATIMSVGSATGVITSVGAGTTSIIYRLATGCTKSVTVTSKPQPAAITGNLFMCLGSANTLHDATAPANGWTSSNTGVATILANGIVTSVASGTTTISYTTGSNGCSITAVLTVNPAPVAGVISSPATVAAAANITATSSGTTGGIWSVSNADATVGSASGVVTGVSAGTVTLSYSVTTCATVVSTKVITVTSAAPAQHTITTGETIMLNTGSTVTMGGDMTGGEWTIGDNSVASVDPVSGTVTGVTKGNTTITYTVTDAEGNTATATRQVVVAATPIEVRVMPNPNKGTFNIKGSTGSISDETVTIEVTDMLGQIVYSSKIVAVNGNVNEHLSLNSSLQNGMYILDFRTATESKSFHFVIEQ